MVGESSAAPHASGYEINEFNEITSSERGLNSYNSLISYFLHDQRSAPAVALTIAASLGLHGEIRLMDG